MTKQNVPTYLFSFFQLLVVWKDFSFFIPSHLIINSFSNTSSLMNLLIKPTYNNWYLKY